MEQKRDVSIEPSCEFVTTEFSAVAVHCEGQLLLDWSLSASPSAATEQTVVCPFT